MSGNSQPMDLTVEVKKKNHSKKRKLSTSSTGSGASSSSSTWSTKTTSSSPTKTTLIRDEHCCCILDNGRPCMNVLSCKNHKLSEKRLVQGRSADIKVLMARNIPKLRVYDPLEHCGVDEHGVICTRSLSCKFHKLSDKRNVTRPIDFDILIEQRKVENNMKELLEKEIQENSDVDELETNMEQEQQQQLEEEYFDEDDEDDDDDFYVFDPIENVAKKLCLDYNFLGFIP